MVHTFVHASKSLPLPSSHSSPDCASTIPSPHEPAEEDDDEKEDVRDKEEDTDAEVLLLERDAYDVAGALVDVDVGGTYDEVL